MNLIQPFQPQQKDQNFEGILRLIPARDDQTQ